jgi:uncharacterized membrane protein
MFKNYNSLRIIRVILGLLSIAAFLYSGLWPFAVIGLILLVMALLKIDYGIGSCEFYRNQPNQNNTN